MAWLNGLLNWLPFANSAMLLWGLAATLPIIIHFWNKRKYNEVSWAAMRFLLAAVRKRSRRVRIEQLLLLLLRVSILLLLALALADPICSLLPSFDGALRAGARTHHLLVIDGSYSMATRTAETSRFQQALDQAAELVRASRQGDGFSLILMDDRPRSIIAEAAFGDADVIEETQSLRVSHGGADLSAALSEVERLLDDPMQHASLRQKSVHIISDLDATTWTKVNDPECRRRLGRLAEKAKISLIDVGDRPAENAAITSLIVRDALVTVGRDVTVEAEIHEYLASSEERRQVTFLIDGQQVHSEHVQLSAEQATSVAFTHRFEVPGEHTLEATLDEDPLRTDNQRWLSVPVRTSIEVLCIEGKPGEAKYVALALEPSREQQPRIRTQVRFENALLEEDLSEYDAVFLCNVGRFTPEEAEVLFGYLQTGGGLVFALGDLVQADSYNHVLGSDAEDRRILPVRIEGLAGEAQYAFDPLGYQHPIVAPFQGHEAAGLLTTPVWRYYQVAVPEKSAARIALAFQNGDPAIVEQPVASGRSLVVTTAMSPNSVDSTLSPPMPWTAWATWPSFPPLVQEILADAIRGRKRERNLTVGDALSGSLPASAGMPTLTMETPDEETDLVALDNRDNTLRWEYDKTGRSGVYAANFGPPLNERWRYALNVDTRESSLERFDSDLLPAQINASSAIDEPVSALADLAGSQYYRWLLALLLLLLMLETLLAWRFGSAAA